MSAVVIQNIGKSDRKTNNNAIITWTKPNRYCLKYQLEFGIYKQKNEEKNIKAWNFYRETAYLVFYFA